MNISRNKNASFQTTQLRKVTRRKTNSNMQLMAGWERNRVDGHYRGTPVTYRDNRGNVIIV